ncbi:MAG: UDP-N-acetylmuramate dehydrogenase [Ferruginibacter sp.]|nr:UDP-N-acetylmuramate dehydrogenase [Ferruginibacter sp.]
MISENISLRKFNTFGIDVNARYFSTFSDEATLVTALDEKRGVAGGKLMPTLILGGGSNILLTKDFNGLVLKNEVQGINIIHEDTTHVYLRAGAGVNWHSLVLHAISHNLAGMENLSLIPGNTGASPMQNIGAYGVEIKDIFQGLTAYHLADKKLVSFSNNDCEFGYRESVFKRKLKDQFVILDVTFRLNKNPEYNISYGAIEQELEAMGIETLSIQAISQAVINIRQSKLPNPTEIGNAGSFFKNPEITKLQFDQLREHHPGIVGYQLPHEKIKLAAGWLIEQAGWKGYRRGDAGCHARQALVLVNHGNATGKDIYTLSTEIIASVKGKFGVTLQREVNII